MQVPPVFLLYAQTLPKQPCLVLPGLMIGIEEILGQLLLRNPSSVRERQMDDVGYADSHQGVFPRSPQ